ncbi:hypothetical protein B0H14DRAFT_2586208 [Mycena olivaceomarginata]|nr:hypothetical protein B0H14DRAFT_2586208 [Mycena olivaceomarginata]
MPQGPQHGRSKTLSEKISEEEEEDEPEGEPDLTTAEMLSLCQKLEKACLTKGQPDQSMALADHLRHFRANVQREEFLAAKQVTLDDMWGRKANNEILCCLLSTKPPNAANFFWLVVTMSQCVTLRDKSENA